MARVRSQVWVALAVVYVVWGSTFLGIRFGLRTVPPFILASSRFLVAGGLLVAVGWRLAARRADRPGWRAWGAAAVLGLTLVAAGNGTVAWAEQRLSTGVASLAVCTVPFWMALFDRVFYGRRLPPLAALGILMGFAGTAVLAGPGGNDRVDALGLAVIILGSVSWAAGSLFARRAPLPRHPLLSVGMQMLLGGVFLGLLATAVGEPWRAHAPSAASVGAIAYLVVVGSIVGFTLYSWLLRNAPTPLVSTYAFVNPVVAILLGRGIEHEPLGLRTLGAGVLIVGAVGLMVLAQAREAPAAAATLDG